MHPQIMIAFSTSGESVEKIDPSEKPCTDALMPERLIGPGRVRVPQLGLGCAPLANFYRKISDEQAEELICYALEKGASFFDTAPLYGQGLSEQRLGAALWNVPRERYTLATKVGRLVVDGRMVTDFSRGAVLRSLEESLKRLRLDRVDILHVHDPDRHYHQTLDEAFPALAELRSAGVIGAIGAGMNQWQMVMDFARNADFDCFLIAGRYTLLEQESLDCLALCAEKKIAVFLGGVYNTGILATGAVPGAKYNYRTAPPEIMDRVRRIEAACARYEVPLRAAAIQFPLAHEAVVSVVIGAESRAEFAQAFEGMCWKIPSELWQDLRQEGLIDPSAPLPP